jgi:hypothetical protein
MYEFPALATPDESLSSLTHVVIIDVAEPHGYSQVSVKCCEVDDVYIVFVMHTTLSETRTLASPYSP